MNRDFFCERRLGFGPSIDDDPIKDPRNWAVNQIKKIPNLGYFASNSGNFIENCTNNIENLSILIGDKTVPVNMLIREDAKVPETIEQAVVLHTKNRLERERIRKLTKTMSSNDYKSFEHRNVNVPFYEAPKWAESTLRASSCIFGESPVFNRFWLFWCNHFTTSMLGIDTYHFVGHHHRTIRNSLTGNFEDLLYKAIAHPAMLVYLDNVTSTGPNSKLANDKNYTKKEGLNENLGRELLELHSVSPLANYTQKDVHETALLLTGWKYFDGTWKRPPADARIGLYFEHYRHEPGTRHVMGKTYFQTDNGHEQLRALIKDLANHPKTANFISYKLARSFISDNPPQSAIEKISFAFKKKGGNLPAIHEAVIDATLEHGPNYEKFLQPEIWLYQAHKFLRLDLRNGSPRKINSNNHYNILRELGQPIYECTQPNGWSELKEDWISKEYIDRRARAANLLALWSEEKNQYTSEALIKFTNKLSPENLTLSKIAKRAESRVIAIATLLASPQFMKV